MEQQRRRVGEIRDEVRFAGDQRAQFLGELGVQLVLRAGRCRCWMSCMSAFSGNPEQSSRKVRQGAKKIREMSARIPEKGLLCGLGDFARDHLFIGRSSAVERKRQHFIDVFRAGGAHDESVETQRDARAFGQAVLQRGEEVLVDRHGRQAARGARG